MSSNKELALEAFESVRKDRIRNLAATYLDAFRGAEGDANAPALRQLAAERFKAGMAVLDAACAAAVALAGEVVT
jgi:hypothetical protein